MKIAKIGLKVSAMLEVDRGLRVNVDVSEQHYIRSFTYEKLRWIYRLPRQVKANMDELKEGVE